MKRDTTMRRLRERTEFADNGCWNWTGPTARSYGSITSRGKRRATHRVSYEFFNGPIPEGLTIDHLCRNRVCLNPDHLEAVTLRENLHRGFSPFVVNSRKTHCDHGHPLSGENLFLAGDGRRRCLACKRRRGAVAAQKWRDQKKAAGLTSSGKEWKR